MNFLFSDSEMHAMWDSLLPLLPFRFPHRISFHLSWLCIKSKNHYIANGNDQLCPVEFTTRGTWQSTVWGGSGYGSPDLQTQSEVLSVFLHFLHPKFPSVLYLPEWRSLLKRCFPSSFWVLPRRSSRHREQISDLYIHSKIVPAVKPWKSLTKGKGRKGTFSLLRFA